MLYHLSVHYGQLTVSAGAAGMLTNTSPIFMALWATLFLAERTKAPNWIGIGAGFLGGVLISFGEGEEFRFEPGALLLLLAALAWSVYFTA